MKKMVIMFILFYLLALVFNFIPSIKFPDADISFANMLITLLFLVTLITLSITEKSIVIKAFLFTGIIGGIIVFLIELLESTLFDNGFYDVLAVLQYPFYILFITPLFGANSLLDINYGLYSLFMALVYLIIFLLQYTPKHLLKIKRMSQIPKL